MSEVTGIRVLPGPLGYLDQTAIDQPATYGKAIANRVKDTRVGWWQVTAPDGSMGGLNPDVHRIVEHNDGTITVTPSIDFSKRRAGGWHGWLTHGVFQSV